MMILSKIKDRPSDRESLSSEPFECPFITFEECFRLLLDLRVVFVKVLLLDVGEE